MRRVDDLSSRAICLDGGDGNHEPSVLRVPGGNVFHNVECAVVRVLDRVSCGPRANCGGHSHKQHELHRVPRRKLLRRWLDATGELRTHRLESVGRNDFVVA